ncbi:MAG: glycosyltransferase family 4 protein [Terrimicrobiaceae bacterium]|nr:glycosyltransferase family 4 protein [Terrimicrobiaceae bacterium]
MKFCFLSSHAHLALDPASSRVSGGAELQVALLARELVRRGHETVIIGGDMGQRDDLLFEGVRTRNGGPFQSGGWFDTLRAVPRVLSILREERPDFALILGWTTWLYLLHRVRTKGCRLVFICGLDTEVNGLFRRENPLRGALFEAGVRGADIRFAMSEYQAEQFARQGLSCGLYRNLILHRTAPRGAIKTVDLLWVARCQPIKRPHLFLDLAEQMPHARCRMICPREDVVLWESIAARARGIANLEFVERVPYREIQSHYDAANVFVNTSSAEGWPNSFIQAGLGAGALLSLDVNPDHLFERFSPGIFAAGDFRALSAGAGRLLLSPQTLRVAQAGCAQFVGELHNNDRNVNAFLAGIADGAI